MEAVSAEVIVVDNGSVDSTAKVARASGAAVVEEARHNVARVRNAGAESARGDVLVFVDADTVVPDGLLRRIAGKAAGMAQGATQFCRKEVFSELNGYDETLFMGEDVDFFRRLKRHARRRGGSVSFIEGVRVVPSARRFDRWGLCRTLVWTNPLFILPFRRRESAWRGWYKAGPR